MSKNHRGKGIKELKKSGRGTCPICKRTGIKLLYEKEIHEKKVTVCKICKVTLSRKAS